MFLVVLEKKSINIYVVVQLYKLFTNEQLIRLIYKKKNRKILGFKVHAGIISCDEIIEIERYEKSHTFVSCMDLWKILLPYYKYLAILLSYYYTLL